MMQAPCRRGRPGRARLAAWETPAGYSISRLSPSTRGCALSRGRQNWVDFRRGHVWRVQVISVGTEAAFTPRFGLDSTPSRTGGDDSIESLRQQLRALQEENAVLNEKLNAVVQAIGAKNADKIVHDIRNLLNELVLLRKLAELEE